MRSLMLLLIGGACGVMGCFAFGVWPGAVRASEPCVHTALLPPAGAASAPSTRHADAASDASHMPGAAHAPELAVTSSTPAPAASLAPVAGTSDLPPNTPEAIAAVPSSAVSDLLLPVKGVQPSELADTFTQARSEGRVHDAIDIMAPLGAPVVAVNDGHVVKLFTSVRGGLTVYQFDPQDRVIYYYAHLDRYAPGLAEGQSLHRGDVIGFVGSTGNASAEAPHLHFEIELLGPKKEWWHGTSINPFGRFAGQSAGVVSSDASRNASPW